MMSSPDSVAWGAAADVKPNAENERAAARVAALRIARFMERSFPEWAPLLRDEARPFLRRRRTQRRRDALGEGLGRQKSFSFAHEIARARAVGDYLRYRVLNAQGARDVA